MLHSILKPHRPTCWEQTKWQNLYCLMLNMTPLALAESKFFEKLCPTSILLIGARGDKRPTDFSDVIYALGWKPDAGLFASLPDLEVMFSVGAGVDHMLLDPALPTHLPLVRFVDDSLTRRMGEWVGLQCLMHLRQQRKYDQQQYQAKWLDHSQPDAPQLRVGIMGLGVLGQEGCTGFEISTISG